MFVWWAYCQDIMKHLRLIVLIVGILTSYSMQAQSVFRGKLSSWLRQTYQESRASNRSSAYGERRVTAFVKTEQPEILESWHCPVYAQLGDICIASIPIQHLNNISQNTGIQCIEASPSAHPTLNHVANDVNILPLYQPTQEHSAFTGEGVIMGVMDIGFDLTHPTFFTDAMLGRYRIKTFWDQLSTDTIGSPFPVGRDYTTEQEILSLGCATDASTQQHGTHTAGIAAGSGFDSPYRGVAFGSDICLVANAVTQDTIYIAPQDYYKYTSATDALGFKYLFDYADREGKPCVVSFSEGYSPYMDDDDLLYSEFLERLTGPGHILVCSAGNERRELTYLEKPLGVATVGALMNSQQRHASYRVQSNGNVSISLQPTDGSVPPFTFHADDKRWHQSEESEDLMLTDTLYLDNDTCAITVTRHSSAFTTSDFIYHLMLQSNRPFKELTPLAFTLAGDDCQAALLGSGSSPLGNHASDSRWQQATSSHNILAPGCFSAPITVGSTTHQLSYVNHQGKTITTQFDDQPGMLSWFSSVGPTIHGLVKPDVVAPGHYVTSSMSSYYLETHPEGRENDVAYFIHDGRTYVWASELGTSMSAPVVAGIIALWLQAKPDLSRDDIIGVFRRTCRQPDTTLSYPNNYYGYGEIDAYRGLLDILGFSSIPSVSQHQLQGVSITTDANRRLHLRFAYCPDRPVRISIYGTNGTLCHQETVMADQPEIVMPLPMMASGIYVIQLSGDSSLTGSQLVTF